MYDNPNLPYRCPKCLQSVSDCTSNALTGKRTCGCLTCSCDAPIFEQKDGESIYAARVKWDKWVVAYRNEHPNWHRENICKGCKFENVSCDFYDDNCVNCSFWRSKNDH